MKKPWILAISLCAAEAIFMCSAQAQQTQQPASNPAQPSPAAPQAGTTTTAKKPSAAKTGQTSATKATTPLTLKTQKDKVSYAIGTSEGKRLKQGITQNNIDIDTAILLRAIKDVLSDGKVLLSDQEVQATLTALQVDLRKKQELQAQQLGETNRKEGEAYLAANKAKEGVFTLPSGLQYKILQEGMGPKPTANDMVTVNYRGTLLNGTEFDSSYKRGQPAMFGVGQVVKGWTEALQLMPVGSKWQLFIPPELAYGPQGSRGIAPNSTLIFEVELLSFQPRTPPVPATAPAPAHP